MKKFIAVCLGVLFSFSLNLAEADSKNCRRACVQRVKAAKQRCVSAYQARSLRCKQWQRERLQVCAINGSRVRLGFCRQQFGKRVSHCLTGHKQRRNRCAAFLRSCVQQGKTFCEKRCGNHANRAGCLSSCAVWNHKRCAAPYGSCVGRAKTAYQRCVTHAKFRRGRCLQGIQGPAQHCRGYAKRAASACLTHARARFHACHKQVRSRVAACAKACAVR